MTVTREAVLAWLALRRPVPPEALLAHLRSAARGGAGPLPDLLAEIGGDLLERTAVDPQSRVHALDLLAADACVTYAFEAQAELDPDGLGALAERVAQRRSTA